MAPARMATNHRRRPEAAAPARLRSRRRFGGHRHAHPAVDPDSRLALPHPIAGRGIRGRGAADRAGTCVCRRTVDAQARCRLQAIRAQTRGQLHAIRDERRDLVEADDLVGAHELVALVRDRREGGRDERDDAHDAPRQGRFHDWVGCLAQSAFVADREWSEKVLHGAAPFVRSIVAALRRMIASLQAHYYRSTSKPRSDATAVAIPGAAWTRDASFVSYVTRATVARNRIGTVRSSNAALGRGGAAHSKHAEVRVHGFARSISALRPYRCGCGAHRAERL